MKLDKLRLINTQFRLYYDRLEVIAKQHRRRVAVTDTSFEQEFRATVEELRKLTDTEQDFWQQARSVIINMIKRKLLKITAFW